MTAFETSRRGFLAAGAGLMLSLALPLGKARADRCGGRDPVCPQRLYPHRHR